MIRAQSHKESATAYLADCRLAVVRRAARSAIADCRLEQHGYAENHMVVAQPICKLLQ
jgi:hypothetical protein